VVVEREVAARHVREVRRDVARADRDLAVLHVLRMDEGDLVDDPCSFNSTAQTSPSKSDRVTRR
jgi:hypothetical protein